MLIELEVKEKGVNCNMVNRLFLDTETGGISTMPIMAERGQDKETALAKIIARAYKSGNHRGH